MQSNEPRSLFGRWNSFPLYVRIIIGLLIGVVLGAFLRPMWNGDSSPKWLLIFARIFAETSRIILRMLGAIAPPLILIAVVRSLLATKIAGKTAARLTFLLLLNTLVAIVIGLFVANTLRPGTHVHLSGGNTQLKANDPLTEFLNSVPSSILGPLVDNNVIGVIILALAMGIGVRRLNDENRALVTRGVEAAWELVIMILHWILALVPLAVLCKVADILTTQGVQPLLALGWFITAVISALLLQAIYYLVRIQFGSWVTPAKLLSGSRDALVMAFSTASSTATMPLTYECLHERIGLKAENASLGSVGWRELQSRRNGAVRSDVRVVHLAGDRHAFDADPAGHGRDHQRDRGSWGGWDSGSGIGDDGAGVQRSGIADYACGTAAAGGLVSRSLPDHDQRDGGYECELHVGRKAAGPNGCVGTSRRRCGSATRSTPG